MISKIVLVLYKSTPNATDRQTAVWSCHGNETHANATIHLVPNAPAATESQLILAIAGSKSHANHIQLLAYIQRTRVQ